MGSGGHQISPLEGISDEMTLGPNGEGPFAGIAGSVRILNV